jgi:hypothetical protein
MNNNTSQAATRVRYAGQPSATTAHGLPSFDADLSRYDLNSLKGLRGKIDDALQADQIGDDLVVNYLDMQQRAAARIEAIEARNTRLAEIAAQSPAIVSSVGDSHNSITKRFSISRAINNAVRGKQQDGAEGEVIAEGQNANPAARGITLPEFVLKRNIYGNDAGSGSIAAAVTGRQTLAAPLLAALHDAPVAQQLGATMVQASGSTFLVPFLGSLIPSTAAEGASASSSASFSQLSLTPQRYARRVDVTTLALRAASPEMDQIIMRSMAEGHATAIDRAAFAAVVANATYATATAGTTADDLAASSIADIFKLAKEATTASGNSQPPNIVCSPLGFQALNTATESAINQTVAGAYRAATGAQVLQANTLQDGDLTSANVVGGSGTIAGAGVAVAGNWADLIVAMWGVDLVLDNVTNAESGVIRCVSNSYASAGVVRDSLRVMGVTATEIAAT